MKEENKKINKATRIFVATLGSIFGISGMSHGLFEVLQGNTPTGGLFIAAIGEAFKIWPHGNEFAFTLIPNFLVTGIAAMIVGFAIVVWSLCFVQKAGGPVVYLSLFVLLLLVGGGVAQIVFFPMIWFASTRIDNPMPLWRKILRGGVRKYLGKLWPSFLAIASLLFVFILEMAITGFVPAVSDPEKVLSIMLTCLVVELVLFPATIVSGFARDLAHSVETVS